VILVDSSFVGKMDIFLAALVYLEKAPQYLKISG
jgi:hypothetical protein